ncbi:DUF1642 domain-containing protein [Streptococcus lutetiensis]|uniref:DUF1642 domain-containing protein n=1 Tax=Streptococcus lutetiensis TaxID=150055 RepID=UPI001BDAFD85|nr:DUF1642 domain-containing protein [Streptococcus lutetiensis]MBT0944443.1 DUF1642 domain-containing protein [Streptococcus lutetiensis]MBT0949860.1 DUF1642 domain-containing protein [Streptococcus lutetiensis]
MNKFKTRVKKRLTDELIRIKSFSSDFYKGEQEGINFALYTIDSVDEPEKPVVPQFVADWYESIKDDFEYNLYKLCTDFREQKLRADLNGWFSNDNNKPIETLVLMHKFGYEVEKEKLYTVEIPNGFIRLVLCKDCDGKLFVATFSGGDCWETFGKCKLTEAEIKEDFEWAWQFAKEVEND